MRPTDARDLDGHPVRGQYFDGRVPPLGLVSSFSSSVARRLIASSGSSDLLFCLVQLGVLGVLGGTQPWLKAPVDAVVATPTVDRPITYAGVVRIAGDARVVCEQREDLASKLCGVAPSSHL